MKIQSFINSKSPAALRCFKMIYSVSLNVLLLFVVAAQNDVFNLTIIHFNDFHAKFEAVDPKTLEDCKNGSADSCIGGFARLFTLSRKLKRENPSALLLNAGDVFTGSLWYRLFKGNVTSYFMNKLPVDAMTIGNHEFDGRMGEAVRYLKNSKLPVLAVNIDSSKEPSIMPYIQKSVIIDVDGKKVGIIGFVTKKFREIASVGKLKLKDEISTVNAEAKLLRSKGVGILVGLSHAGFDEDKRIAKSIDVDIIVGGHSHTFMYSGTPPSSDTPVSDYPTVVEQDNGRKVLIVQAGAFSKYLGYLVVSFDQNNTIQSWSGDPILLDNKVEEDPLILEELEPWRQAVHNIGDRIIGESLVFLDSTPWVCRVGECAIGKLITDAMVYDYTKKRQGNNWTKAAVAFINAGGIRSSISKGNLTYAALLNTLPFSETYDLIELSGKNLLEVMEFSVASPKAEFLQYSGIQASIDLDKPKHHRVSNVKVRCGDCAIPQYEPLKLNKFYKIVLPSFAYEGGDGYKMIKKNTRRHSKGRVDTDVLQDYLSAFSPVFVESVGNIIVHASPKIFQKIKTLFPRPATDSLV